MEDEGPVVTDYASLLRAQVEYKVSLLVGCAELTLQAIIIGSDTLRCLLSILVPIFAKERRNDKDERVISLGLHIVRNLLAIRDVVAPDSATGEKEELSTLQVSFCTQVVAERSPNSSCSSTSSHTSSCSTRSRRRPTEWSSTRTICSCSTVSSSSSAASSPSSS